MAVHQNFGWGLNLVVVLSRYSVSAMVSFSQNFCRRLHKSCSSLVRFRLSNLRLLLLFLFNRPFRQCFIPVFWARNIGGSCGSEVLLYNCFNAVSTVGSVTVGTWISSFPFKIRIPLLIRGKGFSLAYEPLFRRHGNLFSKHRLGQSLISLLALLEIVWIVETVKKIAHFTNQLTKILSCDNHFLHTFHFWETATRLFERIKTVVQKGCQ